VELLIHQRIDQTQSTEKHVVAQRYGSFFRKREKDHVDTSAKSPKIEILLEIKKRRIP
jgi:hypothetical protein